MTPDHTAAIPAIAYLGVMIPLVSIVLGLGVAFWAIYWSYRKHQLQFEERRLMIEKGITPPPIPFEPRRSLDKCLRDGTVLTFLGIGLATMSLLSHAWGRGEAFGLAVAGTCAGAAGLGYLVYYFVASAQKPPRPVGGALPH
jgi:hypothetical protein